MAHAYVTTPDGTMPVYRAVGTGDRLPIVLVHEAFGLNEHITSIADRLALAGHDVVAPHLYYRTQDAPASYDDVPLAVALSSDLTVDEITSDITAAASALPKSGAGFGVIGFCFGGAVACIAASLVPEVSKAVSFYPVSILTYWDRIGPLQAPLLILFGDNDEFLGEEEQRWLTELTNLPGSTIEVEVYSGAGHAFFNDARRDLYAEAVASAAWERTLSFLE